MCLRNLSALIFLVSVIAVAEVIRNVPSVITVRKNSPLLLNCTDFSVPGITDSGVKYTWFKDGKALTPGRRTTVRQNGSLFFQSVKRKKRKHINDEGHYECHMTISAGTVIARRVTIKIASKLSVITSVT
jgi:hypothetical protein